MFLLSSLNTAPSFMPISSLVLKLWGCSFIRDWPEFRKLKVPPSDFLLISGDWGRLGIPNLAWMSLIKCYWMLLNAKVTAFTISELLREYQQGCGGKITTSFRLALKHENVIGEWSVKREARTSVFLTETCKLCMELEIQKWSRRL